MKSSLFFLFTAALWAQSPTPPAASHDLPPDTVIATFGMGQKVTAGELKNFLAVMPPNMQQSAMRDRRAFVEQFALMHRLSEIAEETHLDQQSPTREALAFNRMYLLMNAQLHEVLNSINVPPSDVDTYYKQNQSRFAQVKVKALYIPFGGEGKHRTEAEALAKITELRTKLVAGADFVKTVKENSEDQTSVAKDGDFGVIRHSDNLPDPIRAAIFKLKPGDISEPVKQPNGFYLFRAEEIGVQPLSEVQAEIVNEVKQARFKQYMEETTRGLNLKIQNEGFFGEGGAAPTSGR